MEVFRSAALTEAGLNGEFVQENHSGSRRGVLRGLHYQVINPQAKLVRVVRGEVFDVAVDLSRSSPTFGQWVGVNLSQDNRRQLFVPAHCAHGFFVLSEWAEVVYLVTDRYSPEGERTLLWNDPKVGIDWPLSEDEAPLISEKDANGAALREAEVFE